MPGWPSGYPSRAAWVFYNVTQDFSFWPKLDTVSISQTHPDGIATLDCEVVDSAASLTFEDEDEAYVTFDGTTIWAGHLRAIGQGEMAEHGPRTYRLTGQDYTALLDDDIIGTDTERPRELVASRVTWILGKLDLGVTTNGVSLPSEYVDPDTFEGTTIREALERTADELSLHFYLDFDQDLHMFRSETVTAPFSLDDDAPDYSASFPYSEWSLERDSLELTNHVKVKGKRHVRIVRNYASQSAYGIQRSIIVDDSLLTVAQVIAAGNRRLNQLAEPVIDGHLVCWEPGLQAGMTVGIVNDLWNIDDSYVISGVEMSAVDPHDSGGEAMLRTEVSFTDKRRVGRYPGGRGARERIRKAINKRNRSSSVLDTPAPATLGGCCTPVPIGQNDLNEFGGVVSEGPTSAGTASSGVTHDHTGGDTAAEIPLPDGSNRAGRSLVAYVADAGGEDLQAEMEAAGWSKLIASVGSPFWYRRIDGSEGYTGTDDTSDITVAGVVVDLAAFADVLDAFYDEGPSNPGPWYVAATSSTTDPDDVPEPGSWAGEPAITYVAVQTDGAAVTAGPSGYTLLGEDATQAGNGILLSVWYKVMPNGAAAEDPGSVTTTDSSPTIWTMMVRGGIVSPFGFIVPGPTWVGGNPIEPNGTAEEPYWEVTDGDLVVTADDVDQTLDYIATAPPDMPTQLSDWQITVPFEVGVTQSLVDAGTRRIRIIITRDSLEMYATLYLGDANDSPGISVGDDVDTQAVAITGTTAMLWKFGFDGTNFTAKLWEASASEPAWQVTYDSFDDSTDEDSLRIVVFFGDETAPRTLTISPFIIEGGAQPGDAVDWEIVGYGDGSTVAFTTTYGYVQNTLQVRVDGQVIDTGVTETTPSSGVFTLSSAPYGDPVEGNDGSSVIEARYTRV